METLPATVRLIGGPADGQVIPRPGGIMIEVPRPRDWPEWDGYLNVAYAYEMRGDELVAVYGVDNRASDS